MRLERSINYLKLTDQYKKAETWNSKHRLKKPDCFKDTFKKVLTMPIFTNSKNLVGVLIGGD